MDSPRRQLLDDGPPPPVRAGPGKPVIILTCGGIVAALLLIVVLNIEQESSSHRHLTDENIIELIAPPGRLTEADLEAVDGGGGLHPWRAERGWIETRKRDGSPAQRYRCESLDPSPEGMSPGWLEMTHMRLEIFSEKRIVTIAGDTALAFAPQRAVEQGTIRGNVIVSVFDTEPGRPANVERDRPSLQMRTDEATFDNFLGEIRANGRVVVEAPNFTMPGDRLSVLIDDQNDEVRITMAQVDYIRMVREERARSPRSAMTSGRTLASSRFASTAPRVSTAHLGDVPAPESRFYVLTLHDNVRIDEGTRESRRTATGDRLEVIFSSKTEAIGSPLARSTAPQPPSLPGALATITLASLNRTPGLTSEARKTRIGDIAAAQSSDIEHLLAPNVTLIRATGPLTIEPLREPGRALARAEDARIELAGRPVRLCGFGNQSQVTARTLVYETDRDRIELLGSPAHPLRVNTPEMEAGGERFHLAQLGGEGGFSGGGWMTRRDRDASEWPAMACAPAPAPGSGQPPHVPQRVAPPQPSEEPELHITWEDGVDLQFDEEGGGRMRSAIFTGSVNVASAEFSMTADQMAVRFAEQGGSDAIESIHATGAVNVTGVLARSAIRATDLHLDLVQTATGKTIPKLMVATGDVLAFDEEQTIWADNLRVSFRESTAAPDDEEGVGGLLRGRGADVEEFVAERDVQVILANGARIFAERLTGDGVNETVELTAPGQNVAVVSDRMIVDQATRVTLDRKNGRASVPGAGQFRMYERPVGLEPEEKPAGAPPRVERPAIDEDGNPLELRARWLRSMDFNLFTNDGAGSIDLHGDVSVVSDPSPIEHNTMTGEALTLDFAFVETPERQNVDTTAGEEPEPSRRDPLIGDGRQRQLAALTARQDAKIESQTWDDADAHRAGGEPRIFYVAGHHVEYHALTGKALVVGDGSLLIHDTSPATDGESAAPFGAKGSTMLTWDGKLELTRRLDSVFDLTATRNVRLRHRDLNDAISTVVADELNATAIRSGEVRRGDLDFGGSARLERVRAAGAVEIVTDQRTINCGEFDYNVEAGVAQILAATLDRDITIRTAGSAFPMHAQAAIWNMQRDTINITQGRGRR